MRVIPLNDLGNSVEHIICNVSPSVLYEEAIWRDASATISGLGALIAYSGTKTGRSFSDKRVVDHVDTSFDVWWGDVNVAISDHVFQINFEEYRSSVREDAVAAGPTAALAWST